MRYLLTVLLAGIIIMGCSQSVVTPETSSMALPEVKAGETANWTWGQYTIAISEDHTQAEIVPVRNSNLHLNVTKFVEGPPCPDCLTIGAPHVQPDGSIKLQISLKHPFPGQPMYTGFDVRGIVVFKATDYYFHYIGVDDDNNVNEPYLLDDTPLYYSDPAKGGAALLNADGYTFYLNQWLIFPDVPGIFNYYPGKQAQGDPDCTVNPYKLFADGSKRRMFRTSDSFTRTYHIQPPAGGGAFDFGYIVSACWAEPDNIPVTDPENDFPVEANCEDPYGITLEQLQPISYDVVDEPLFKATVKHRPGQWPILVDIVSWTLSNSPSYQPQYPLIRWHDSDVEYVDYIDDETTEVILRIKSNSMGYFGNGLVPGYHLGICHTLAIGKSMFGSGQPTQLFQPVGVYPVMIYVEL